MADETSATPVAAAPDAQIADTETKTPAVGDLKIDDTPAEPAASKVDEPKATPAEEEKPAEPESKPDTVKQDEETAKPAEGKIITCQSRAMHPTVSGSYLKDSTDHRDNLLADSTEKAADDDVEMKDAPDATAAPAPEDAGEEKPEAAESAPVVTPKGKTPRRKSTAGADSVKGKKLNKKASKALITHLDAKPGDHYFIKLKGFPQWPCIICDEDMLPQALIKTRPVSAARADGSYRDDYADGGKRAVDRSFPIMYLATNEL